MARDEVFSVRLDAEAAREVRWAAAESGKTVSRMFRDGLGPLLAYIRAEWYIKHGEVDDDWEIVEATPGPRRELDSPLA